MAKTNKKKSKPVNTIGRLGVALVAIVVLAVVAAKAVEHTPGSSAKVLEEQKVYVASWGSDYNDGRKTSPLRSVQKAVLAGPNVSHVIILGSEYRLTGGFLPAETLELNDKILAGGDGLVWIRPPEGALADAFLWGVSVSGRSRVTRMKTVGMGVNINILGGEATIQDNEFGSNTAISVVPQAGVAQVKNNKFYGNYSRLNGTNVVVLDGSGRVYFSDNKILFGERLAHRGEQGYNGVVVGGKLAIDLGGNWFHSTDVKFGDIDHKKNIGILLSGVDTAILNGNFFQHYGLTVVEQFYAKGPNRQPRVSSVGNVSYYNLPVL